LIIGEYCRVTCRAAHKIALKKVIGTTII
jgi:hypothetical protein